MGLILAAFKAGTKPARAPEITSTTVAAMATSTSTSGLAKKGNSAPLDSNKYRMPSSNPAPASKPK